MYELQVPNMEMVLHPGDIVKLHRFSSERWLVSYGWFSFGGNKPMCGWFVTSQTDKTRIKPLNLSDLDDIYQIDIGACCNCHNMPDEIV